MDFITWCSASKSCVSAKGTEIAPMMSIISVYHKSKYIYIYIYIYAGGCASDMLILASFASNANYPIHWLRIHVAGKLKGPEKTWISDTKVNHPVPCRLIISVAMAAMAMNAVQNPASRLEVKCLARVSNPMEPMARNSSENNEHGCRPRVPTSCPYWPLLTHGNG